MKIYYREKSGGIEILRCFGIELSLIHIYFAGGGAENPYCSFHASYLRKGEHLCIILVLSLIHI